MDLQETISIVQSNESSWSSRRTDFWWVFWWVGTHCDIILTLFKAISIVCGEHFNYSWFSWSSPPNFDLPTPVAISAPGLAIPHEPSMFLGVRNQVRCATFHLSGRKDVAKPLRLVLGFEDVRWLIQILHLARHLLGETFQPGPSAGAGPGPSDLCRVQGFQCQH